MAKKKTPNEMEILLARSLFRADKWNPERDGSIPFEWDVLRTDYLGRSRRLLRTFEKDGLSLIAEQAAAGATATH